MERLGKPAKRVLAKTVDKAASPASPSQGLVAGARRGSDGLPVLYDSECDTMIPQRVWSTWKEEGKPRELIRDLTTAEYQCLLARAQALGAALEPFPEEQHDEIEKSLAAMFGGFRSMRQTGQAALDTIDITLAVLRNFPAWAITRACLKIARGEVGLDDRYPPNDAQIHAIVEAIVKRYAEARDKITLLMSAPVETKNG